MVTEINMQDMLTPLPEPDNVIRVIMFYGATCGPCKATMPYYELVSNMFENMPIDIKFFKINAWEPPEQLNFIKEVYGINGVPHFKVFFRSQYVTEKIGGGDEIVMRNFIYQAIDEVFKQHGGKE